MKKYLYILIISTVFSSSLVWAESKGTTAVTFLKIGAGARPTSLGEAYSAVSNEIDSILYNPAGISSLRGINFTFMYHQRFMDTKYGFLASCLNIESVGTLGISLSYCKVDKIKRVDNFIWNNEYFEASDTTVAFTYGRSIKERLHIGSNLKIINSKIDNEDGVAFALDAGLISEVIPDRLNIGICIQNLGSKLTYYEKGDSLPLGLKIGSSLVLLDDKLIILSEINKYRHRKLGLSFGSEYILGDTLLIRLGYSSVNDDSKGIAAGIGLKFEASSLDIAYVPYKNFEDSFKVSLNTGW